MSADQLLQKFKPILEQKLGHKLSLVAPFDDKVKLGVERRRYKWTRETALAALRAFAKEHGTLSEPAFRKHNAHTLRHAKDMFFPEMSYNELRRLMLGENALFVRSNYWTIDIVVSESVELLLTTPGLTFTQNDLINVRRKDIVRAMYAFKKPWREWRQLVAAELGRRLRLQHPENPKAMLDRQVLAKAGTSIAPRRDWDNEDDVIEEGIVALLRGLELRQPVLRAAGMTSLINAMYRHPSKRSFTDWRRLVEAAYRSRYDPTYSAKTKKKKPVGYWRGGENIIKEALMVLEQGGMITSTWLQRNGRSDLLSGIEEHPSRRSMKEWRDLIQAASRSRSPAVPLACPEN